MHYTSKQNLDGHIATVHIRKTPFRCAHCGLDFALKKNLMRHLTSIHTRTENHEDQNMDGHQHENNLGIL